MERIVATAIAAKIEAVSGTDAAPTLALNAVRQVGLALLQLEDMENGDRTDEAHAGMGALGKLASVGRFGQIDVTLAIKGAGTDYYPGVRPEWDPFLRAAGFSSAASGEVGVAKVEYTSLDSGSFETLTLHVYADGNVYKLVGCIVLPKFSVATAKKGLWTFTVIGRVVVNPALAALTGLTLSSVEPPTFHSQTVSIGAWTSALAAHPLICKKIDGDFGTQHAVRDSGGHTDGLAGHVITNRQLSLTMETESVPLSVFNPFGLAREATGQTDAKVTFQLGSAQYNRVKFELGQWNLRPRHTDLSGLYGWTLSGIIAARSLPVIAREIRITVD